MTHIELDGEVVNRMVRLRTVSCRICALAHCMVSFTQTRGVSLR